MLEKNFKASSDLPPHASFRLEMIFSESEPQMDFRSAGLSVWLVIVSVIGGRGRGRVESSRIFRGTYPITFRTHAGVCAAAATLARATKARARVDLTSMIGRLEMSGLELEIRSRSETSARTDRGKGALSARVAMRVKDKE